MAEWPDWAKIEGMVREDNAISGNNEFNTFKKTVLKVSEDEIAAQAEHAAVMWEFLIKFAACKKMYRRFIIQVFNKLTQVPSWLAAWEAQPRLHEQVRNLHEDLQAALGAQHEVIMKSIAPEAMKSMVAAVERPEHVRVLVEKEKILDQIREESDTADAGAHFDNTEASDETSAAPASGVAAHQQNEDLAALQAGIDAAVCIDDARKLASEGHHVLSQLRIGCVTCAGQEHLFAHECRHSHQVFSFLLSLAKVNPRMASPIAEVMNQLLASPSWMASFEGSLPLRESLQELPVEVQAALGMQHEKVMEMITPQARDRATGKDLDAFKQVADKMKSIRVPSTGLPAAEDAAAAPPPPPPPLKDEWQQSKTPEGHCYYYNLRTRQSQWERPEALGGPIVYTVGDDVEVWSNSQKTWALGKVSKVDGDKVTCEFKMPGGGVGMKELPSSHKDLRPASAPAPAPETWSSEEQTAYRSHFGAVPGSADKKTGVEVAKFLGASGLKRPALKQVWAVANPSNRQDFEFEDFARCCRLVAHCQAMGPESPLVEQADRPLRVKLRTDCLNVRPPQMPDFRR